VSGRPAERDCAKSSIAVASRSVGPVMNCPPWHTEFYPRGRAVENRPATGDNAQQEGTFYFFRNTPFLQRDHNGKS
jgi:hypothetical protein